MKIQFKRYGVAAIAVIFVCSLTAPALAQNSVSVYNILPDTLKTELISCDVDAVEFDRLMSLSLNDFDQDFTGGWRALDYKDDCSNAAAEIIKAYILYSAPHLPKSISSLRWHAGQTKASAGKTEEAIVLFASRYNPNLETGAAWNLYVDATIAFLRNDKLALQTAHDTLAATPVSEEEKASRRKFIADNPDIAIPKGFVDAPNNLSPVQNLLNCFGKPYSEAYGTCNHED